MLSMDAIDKRNMREKIARSIIKRQYVHYLTQEELERQKESEHQKKKAQEIYNRLQSEEKEDEAAKKEEIRKAVLWNDSGYNAATKSHSGDYGKNKPTDEVTKSQIEQILSEKDNAFMKTLQDSIDHSKNQ